MSDGPVDLDALQAAAEAATPGPWRACETLQHAEMFVVDARGFLMDGIVAGPTYEKKNVEFIAAADPPTVVALVAELRMLRGKSDEEYDAERAEATTEAFKRFLNAERAAAYARALSDIEAEALDVTTEVHGAEVVFAKVLRRDIESAALNNPFARIETS